MKQIIFFISTLFVVLGLHAQTAVNEDGSIKFRGNVAIVVDSKCYTFSDGVAVKTVDDGTSAALKTSLRAIAMQKFQNMCFGIVNRDDEATKQVEELIEENKLEDYLDGISAKAKNQGADYLYLVEAVVYGENDAAVQIEISTRLINVENNMGYHSFFRSNPVKLKDEDQMRRESTKIVKDFSSSLENTLMKVFPEQYFIQNANGKELTLGAYQPNGKILSTDKFYAFKFQKENMQIGGNSAPIQVLENVAVCQNPTLKNGQLTVKADKQVSKSSDIVLFRNVAQPVFCGTNQMTITFFGLIDDRTTFDDMVKGRINNAMFDAITKHAGLQLIEHDHLASLKEERELQKSEDFIDGHVVEQMKSIGAMFLLKLEDYQRNGANVSLKVSLISVEQNMILRTVDVVSSIDNIENEMYKQLCDRFAFPCVVKMIGKDKLELSSVLSLTDDDDCILELTKATKNPMTGELSYSRADLCSLKMENYQGNKCLMSIDKVFSKDDMKGIENFSVAGLVTVRIDGTKIKSNVSDKTDVRQKAGKEEKKPKQKKESTFSKLKNALLNKATFKISHN